jgi:hypothetical protein
VRFPVLASAVTYTYLKAGSQTIRLAYDGKSISQGRVDGPYRVRWLWVSNLAPDADLIDLDNNTLDHKDSAYLTASYRFSDFETLGATFTDRYFEQGVDSKGDGRYKSLTIGVELAISTSGTYTIVGDLYDGQGRFISQAARTGSQSPAMLEFDKIRGTIGPYGLRNLYLLNADDQIVDSRPQATPRNGDQSESRTQIVDKANRLRSGPRRY